MRTLGLRALAVAVAVGSFLLLGALTRLPYQANPDDEARIRLSWRIRGEQAGGCRTPTEEELRRLPTHMRNPDACVGQVAPFGLQVHLDERLAVSDTVRPSGVRGDRPVYVFRDVPVRPGVHRLRIRFEQHQGSGGEGEGEGARVRLELDRTVRLASRESVLVTVDPDRLELVVRRSPPDARERTLDVNPKP